MLKTRFDIDCENLDAYFANEMPNLTPEAKDVLPRDVIFKLFRKGGSFNSNSTSKLGFIAKLYILCRCLRKRWYIVIEDEGNGIHLAQFNDIPRLVKERDISIPNAKALTVSGGFILGDREVCDTFSYLNRLSASKPYNYLIKAKNAPKNKVAEADKHDIYIVRFLVNWEGCKKTIVSQTGMNMPEILVLLALFDGEEMPGSRLYHELFKRAYQSSPAKIKSAFGLLQQRGYIKKYGILRGAKMQITAIGRDVVKGILHKYLLSW